MATVRASCATCGDVELTTKGVQVQVCSSTDQGSYSFRCPTCLLIVTKPAEPRVLDLLLSAGVRLVTWQLPAQLSEPKIGPPICHDDLLAFHFDIQEADWLEQMIKWDDGIVVISMWWVMPLVVGLISLVALEFGVRRLRAEIGGLRAATADLRALEVGVPEMRRPAPLSGLQGRLRPGEPSPYPGT